MKARLDRETIAMRVAREFKDGDFVNLGIGIPTLASNYIPEGRTVIFHTENGALGFGPIAVEEKDQDIDLINAGGQFVTPLPGMSFFDSAISFAMIRGGHVDITVLGAMQVSEKGDLANWMFPERGIGNIGGAMDLAVGAKKVIVAMEHNDKNGKYKIAKRCTYPLTAKECVNLIVTDLAVMEVTPKGLLLKEIAPGWTPQEVQTCTEPRLILSPELKEIEL
ncbi:MAG: CoA transferase subunit B [Chloroflexi bacterium]|nr:CoA transferase subunit B [Chloroflexota bacterium]